MKMRRIVFACLFFLAGASLASAQVKLTFNPAQGTKYEYLTEMAQTIKQNAMGQEIPMETEMTMVYLMDVKNKNAQETQTQFTYQDVSYIISSPMMKMGYDSKNPIENPTEMDNMLGKIFSNLIGKPFTVTVAPDGSVNSVTGMEAIAEGMAQAVATDGPIAAQMGASMKQQFSDASLKNSFEQSLKIYPANPVKVGDSWEAEQTLSISGMNTTTKTKYTLKEIKKNIAIIAVESTLNMKPAAGMEGSLSGTQTGTMQVETKTGMPVSSEISQDIKGSIKTQGVDVLMEIYSKIKVLTKEIK